MGGSQTYGAVGGVSGASLGSVQAGKGEFFDRSELPKRFRRMDWSDSEIEAVDSAGASLWN
jgi:small subunit ribosomal protein YMR-31